MALRELKKLKASGYECQILISDLGAFLDNQKCPWAAIQVKDYSLKNFFQGRKIYYEVLLKEIMKTIDLKDVPIYHSSENEYKEQVLKYLLDFN